MSRDNLSLGPAHSHYDEYLPPVPGSHYNEYLPPVPGSHYNEYLPPVPGSE